MAISIDLQLTVTLYVSARSRLVVLCCFCLSTAHFQEEVHEEKGNSRTQSCSRWKATASNQKNLDKAALPLRLKESNPGHTGQWRGTSVVFRVPISETK